MRVLYLFRAQPEVQTAAVQAAAVQTTREAATQPERTTTSAANTQPESSSLTNKYNSDMEELPEPSYKDKIQLVGDILQKDVTVVARPGNNISMALENNGGESVSLPPAEGFVKVFQKWTAELKGAEGSKRGTSKPGEVLDLHSYPSRPKGIMKAYTIGDRPWQQVAPPPNRSLFQSTLYRGKDEPMIKLQAGKFKLLENGMREQVSVLSHLDWFLAASKTELQKRAEELETREPIDLETLARELEDFTAEQRNGIVAWAQEAQEKTYQADLATWNSMLNVVGLIESAARCTQDAATLTVEAVSTSTVMRRDSWLDKLSDMVPKESLMELRGQEVNGERLFSEEGLKAATEVVEAKKSAKVQDRYLAGASRVERPRYESHPAASQSHTGPRGSRGFQRRFRRDESATNASNPPQAFRNNSIRGRKRRFNRK
jgi:hypothetical protein